jgi:hypothetical protein
MNLAKVYIRPGNPLFNYEFPIEGQYWTEMDYLMAWAGLHRHVQALVKKYGYTSKRAWKTAKTKFYTLHPTFKALETERRSGQVPKEVWAQCCKDASHFLEFMDEKVHEEDAPYAMRLRWMRKSQGEGLPSILTPSAMHDCPASFNMDEGKRAQWIMLHEIWGRSLTKVNPFSGSWVKTGDDPQYTANHSALGFSMRSRSAKCDLTKCSYECISCIQEELVYPEVGPKGVYLTVDTSTLFSDEEDVVELAVELLATIDGLKHRPPIKGEDDDALQRALHVPLDLSSYNENLETYASVEEQVDRYLDDDVVERTGVAPKVHPRLRTSSRITTADEWIESEDRAIEKCGSAYWREELGYPTLKPVTVVEAVVKEEKKVAPQDIKTTPHITLYDWMCPAIAELRAKFPSKGILRKTTLCDMSKVKPIPCGMPVKQNGTMHDPNYK